eukprot:10694364-Alexandrium_andersonii.AAC.1
MSRHAGAACLRAKALPRCASWCRLPRQGGWPPCVQAFGPIVGPCIQGYVHACLGKMAFWVTGPGV